MAFLVDTFKEISVLLPDLSKLVKKLEEIIGLLIFVICRIFMIYMICVIYFLWLLLVKLLLGFAIFCIILHFIVFFNSL
jgi:hypothetical protein